MMEHNQFIVALSIFISYIYSCVALDFASRSKEKQECRKKWKINAALTMAIGLLSFQFISIVAFEQSMQRAGYIFPMLMLSILLVTACSYVAFTFFASSLSSPIYLLLAACFITISNLAIHSMDMSIFSPNPIRHHPIDFFASIIIGFFFLWVALKQQSLNRERSIAKLGTNGLFFTIGIVCMHYVGEISLSIDEMQPYLTVLDPAVENISLLLTLVVTIASLFVVLLFTLGYISDKQLRMKSLNLQESENRYQSFIDLNPDGVFILDRKRRIVKCNRAFEQLCSRPFEQFKNTDYTLFIKDPENRSKTKEAFKKVLNGETSKQTVTVTNFAGELIDLEATSVPHVVNGETIGVIGIVKDITDIKKAEELVRQSEKLAVVGELAAGVAHEIRNPLTTLKGFAQMFFARSSEPENEKFLKIMLDEIERINFIVSEFMVLAKPHMTIMQPKDIISILKSVKAILDTQAVLKNIEIDFRCPNETISVVCEENQVKQVFMNVIKNAIEAMKDGGTIQLIVDQEKDRNVTIHVIDEGVGIPKENISQLGQPFFTTKPEGTGLGLMVSYKIIENHNGKIKIASEENKGTAVTITLPVAMSTRQENHGIVRDAKRRNATIIQYKKRSSF